MIRFFASRKIGSAVKNPSPLNLIQKVSFCSQKPEKTRQRKNFKRHFVQENQKIKFVTGDKKFHPLYRMAQKQLVKNMKERFQEQRRLIERLEEEEKLKQSSISQIVAQKINQAISSLGLPQIKLNENIKTVKQQPEVKKQTQKKVQQTQPVKEKQKESEDNDSEKKNKMDAEKTNKYRSHTLIAIIGMIFSLYQLIDIEDRKSQISTKKLVTSEMNEYIYKEIQSNTYPILISVRRRQFQKVVTIIINFVQSRKKVVIPEEMLVQFLNRIELMKNPKISVKFSFQTSTTSKVFSLINNVSLLILAVLVFNLRATQGLRFAFRGSKAKNPANQGTFSPITPDKMKILFKDVAGMHEAKVEVTEFIHFLKDSSRYKEMGAKVPKGILLTGPPGTGKTLLAKACAGETKVNFFSLSGSQFVQKFSGLGASRVRQLFDKAEQCAPSIIFIDEIDAIGKKRDAGPFSNEERDNTLNQLLVRMDGFQTQHQVIVMAATNRKDMLDPALLRPGRFDRSVQIGLPNFQERQQILAVHIQKVVYDTTLTEKELLKKIAVLTPGFSGAELANTCNQAAILAARQNLQKVQLRHFQKATERVMAGLQKRNVFTPEQKQMLAYYQCGKAIVSWFTEGSDPIIKISIVPFSKSSTGFSHSIKNQTALHTMNELMAKASCYLAGRASEMYFKGYTTTNGDNDLHRAKKIITMIVTKFGMSESLKMIAYPDFEFIRKPYSEKIQSLIDQEITKLSQECQKKVETLIKEKQKQILLLKDKLLQKQTLTHNCIKQILGERQVKSENTNYQEYLKGQEEDSQKNEEVIQPQSGTL